MASKKLRIISWILTLLAVMAGIAGGYSYWKQHRSNQANIAVATERQRQANQGRATGDNPSTVKPDENSFLNYRVAADLPRYISIPKIGVNAIVGQVGLTQQGNIGAPTNVYNTAWYNGSAKPGNKGAMLIDGHVSSWTTPGVFHDLHQLRKGDMIHVERGDGVAFYYKVVMTRDYEVDAVDMKKVLAPINPDKPGLNLITCGGEVTEGTNNFSKRIVVFTEQQ